MGVAEAAVAALGQAHAVAGVGEVGDQGLAILFEHLGADRHLEHRVRPVRARAVAAHAMHPGLALEVLLVAVVDQGVQPLDGLDPDIAAAPAIAAVRASELDELLTPERHGSAPSVAGAHIDLGLIEELHRGLIVQVGGCVEVGA